jgi:adenylate cyclase class IV
MPTNVEMKTWIVDGEKVAALVATRSDTPPRRIRPRDTFFGCSTGRLKPRELEAGEGELIDYDRADFIEAKQSHYEITSVAHTKTLKSLLRQALGQTVVVEKKRVLDLVGQTCVHLDSVNGLGTFLELEVVLQPNQSSAEGHDIARELMRQLEIQESDLLATAYSDMLAELATSPATTLRPSFAEQSASRDFAAMSMPACWSYDLPLGSVERTTRSGCSAVELFSRLCLAPFCSAA